MEIGRAVVNRFWGIFEKRFVELNTDERVVLALVVLIAVCLVVVAFSLLLQVTRRLEFRGDTPNTNKLVRKGMGRVAQIDYYPEHARPSHSD